MEAAEKYRNAIHESIYFIILFPYCNSWILLEFTVDINIKDYSNNYTKCKR